uniref:Uncharacterized protein n=1 Tax=Candidatus Kentrum sp. FW TaxID=2126338 RepID=A0A450TXR0_9GAMM|nr:MAG: hypothetical protein BECKFW1821C_GA0114237_10574 [Candidatus Kentron sp. FW]
MRYSYPFLILSVLLSYIWNAFADPVVEDQVVLENIPGFNLIESTVIRGEEIPSDAP